MTQQVAVTQTPRQVVLRNGRLKLPTKGLVVRIISLTAIGLTIIFNLWNGQTYHDPLIIYSTILPLHVLVVMILGWFFFKDKYRARRSTELVSILIPVYNQESMIRQVVDACYQSNYPNYEVLVINDGSTDRTKEILVSLKCQYPELIVINKLNEGKRKAVASGFSQSRGKLIVLIDSDSIIDTKAVSEIVRVLVSSKDVGGVVGEVKVWNEDKNILTRCQTVWYDNSFNIGKAAESVIGTVQCCSGCLAGYKRKAIADVIPYWVVAPNQVSDDRDLTHGVVSPTWYRTLQFASQFDDAEDRIITSHTLGKGYKTLYCPKAVVYTDVPETLKSFTKQQIRWKKGYIRSNFFASVFFWQKHPLAAFMFYTDFMISFTSPIILFTVFFWEPFILKNPLISLVFLLGSISIGLAQGYDYKCRVPQSKYWYYKPLMNFLTSFVIAWLIIPALLRIRKNEWLTR